MTPAGLLAICLVHAGALWLRMLPSRSGIVGGDAWFYLLWAEAMRRQRRLGVRLSCYLLDIEEQWYPPLFGVLLASMPSSWRQPGRTRWLAPLIDLIHLGVLCATAVAIGLPPLGVLAAALIYATAPALVHEFSTLGSRSLASLLLSLFMVSCLAFETGRGRGWWIAAGLAGALLLLTHKMAAQLWVVLLAMLALRGRDGSFVPAVAILSVAGAFVLSGGFYRKVLRGHWEALRFWKHHAGDLNAHPVYDSPLFAATLRPEWRDSRFRRRMFMPGWRGQLRLLRLLFALNPWWVLLPVLWMRVGGDERQGSLLWWATVGVAMAMLTTFVPILRCLGPGARYLKFTIFPLALVVGQEMIDPAGLVLIVPLLVVCSAAIWKLRTIRELEVLTPDFERMVAFVKTHPADAIAALPSSRCDPLAFLAGKKVLWGLHSAGYDRLAEWFPVLRRPLLEMMDAYDVDLLLVDREFVDPQDLALQGRLIPAFEAGLFVLYERASSLSSKSVN